MKKLFLSLIVLIAMAFIFPIASSASTDQPKNPAESLVKEYKNNNSADRLFNKALENDINKVLPNNEAREKQGYNKVSSIEKVGSYVDSEGRKREVVAASTFYLEDNAVNNRLIAASYDASEYESSLDDTLGITAYSTVYYNHVSDSRGSQHEDIVSVSGGWNISDNRVSLSDMSVTIGQNGWSSFSGGTISGQKVNHYPNGLTWSYNAPSSWDPVVVNGGGQYTSGVVGVTSYTKYHRGSTTWDQSFTNNL
ncbi:hypothetical protein [Virgibacillus ihumii]|uniref:hypothetical protein n=1 Tax=Virgibacillus ihumii TaxID=2686091 RepID=UPI00157C9EC1|nr:hypothetical protein [Virgibacillus ihumii]